MSVCTARFLCLVCSLDYLKIKFESKSRLPIPEFSGYHCMKLMFDTLKIYANAIFTYTAFVSKKSISCLFPIHFLSISCLFVHISHWYTMFHGVGAPIISEVCYPILFVLSLEYPDVPPPSACVPQCLVLSQVTIFQVSTSKCAISQAETSQRLG